jgi:hypothetical protein
MTLPKIHIFGSVYTGADSASQSDRSILDEINKLPRGVWGHAQLPFPAF